MSAPAEAERDRSAAVFQLDFVDDWGVAQLGEHCVRNAEVGSSILLLSTNGDKCFARW